MISGFSRTKTPASHTSLSIYASAVERNPEDYDAIYNWALFLQESADNVSPDSDSPSKDAFLLEEACKKYADATRLCPTLHDVCTKSHVWGEDEVLSRCDEDVRGGCWSAAALFLIETRYSHDGHSFYSADIGRREPLVPEATTEWVEATTPTSESVAPAVAESGAPPTVEAEASASAESGAPPPAKSWEESSTPVVVSGALPTSQRSVPFLFKVDPRTGDAGMVMSLNQRHATTVTLQNSATSEKYISGKFSSFQAWMVIWWDSVSMLYSTSMCL
ncbi:hypothetical protein ACET3Z_008278 [Daucus carota]